ncbi:hypothetical protein [Listeria booriae]|uniref:hypothetical protein n=1 Tax=Listeria booriae TaxID=1552123 RepID=UPI0016267216|nr:hypothetical protein [Listeria booriae]MBC1212477.1 hypothetical protein [Listeria booriae]MBC1309352.1 hypothetical protein [Listeria booriae]
MEQDELKKSLYTLLKKVKDYPEILNDKVISRDEAKIYRILESQDYVHGIEIAEYYDGPNLSLSNANITDTGYAFLHEMEAQEKPIRMSSKNKYIQLQVFLERVDDADNNLEKPNPRVRTADYYELISYAIKKKLVTGLVIKYASNKPSLIRTQDVRLTPSGLDLLDIPFEETDPSIISQTINIYDGDFRNSSLGSGNTQNN